MKSGPQRSYLKIPIRPHHMVDKTFYWIFAVFSDSERYNWTLKPDNGLFLEKKNEVAFGLFHVTQKRNIALSIEADEDEGVESCNNEDKQGTPKRWMST